MVSRMVFCMYTDSLMRESWHCSFELDNPGVVEGEEQHARCSLTNRSHSVKMLRKI